MPRLTDSERETLVQWLFDSETAFLVELILELMPYEDAKKLVNRLTEECEDA